MIGIASIHREYWLFLCVEWIYDYKYRKGFHNIAVDGMLKRNSG